jgi:hypothetical protein
MTSATITADSAHPECAAKPGGRKTRVLFVVIAATVFLGGMTVRALGALGDRFAGDAS